MEKIRRDKGVLQTSRKVAMMSKADELRKKMGQPVVAPFTPRQSVEVKPLPDTADMPVEAVVKQDGPPKKGVHKSNPQEPKAKLPEVGEYANKYRKQDEQRVVFTSSIYPWRQEQLEDEAKRAGLKRWQIIDIALEIYFRQREGK